MPKTGMEATCPVARSHRGDRRVRSAFDRGRMPFELGGLRRLPAPEQFHRFEDRDRSSPAAIPFRYDQLSCRRGDIDSNVSRMMALYRCWMAGAGRHGPRTRTGVVASRLPTSPSPGPASAHLDRSGKPGVTRSRRSHGLPEDFVKAHGAGGRRRRHCQKWPCKRPSALLGTCHHQPLLNAREIAPRIRNCARGMRFGCRVRRVCRLAYKASVDSCVKRFEAKCP